jgi:hypothetical protein
MKCGLDSFDPRQDPEGAYCERGKSSSGSIKGGEFVGQLSYYQFLN